MELTLDQTVVKSQQRLSSFGGVVGGVGGSGLRLSCYQRLRCSSDTPSQSEPDLRTGRSEWEVQSLYGLGETLSVTLIVSRLCRRRARSERGSGLSQAQLSHMKYFCTSKCLFQFRMNYGCLTCFHIQSDDFMIELQ